MKTAPEHISAALEQLQSTPPTLFRNIPKHDLAELFTAAAQRRAEPFEELLPGFPDGNGHGFLVVEGLVEARKNGTVIEQFSAGEFIGEAFLHSKTQLSCELRASVPTWVLIFKRSDLVQFFRSRPEKTLKIYTMNVIDAQHRHIISLYSRITQKDPQTQGSL